MTRKGMRKMKRKRHETIETADGGYDIGTPEACARRAAKYERERWGRQSAKSAREEMLQKLAERNRESNFSKDGGRDYGDG